MPVNQRGDTVLLTPASAGRGYEPVLRHRFNLTITRPPDGLGNPPTDMMTAVRSFASGGSSITTADARIVNTDIRYPTGRAVSDASLNLVLYGGKQTSLYQYVWNWLQLVHNDDTDEVGVLMMDQTGGCGGDATLDFLNPDATVAATASLGNMYPIGFSTNESSFDSDVEPVILTAKFVVSTWTWQGN